MVWVEPEDGARVVIPYAGIIRIRLAGRPRSGAALSAFVRTARTGRLPEYHKVGSARRSVKRGDRGSGNHPCPVAAVNRKVGGNARPHPGVDSLAPARSALRAFGSAEFLSPFLKRLKTSPRRRRNRCRLFRKSSRWKGRTDGQMIIKCAKLKSSPGGEDRGEGERYHKLCWNSAPPR